MKCRSLVEYNQKQNLVWFGSYGLNKEYCFPRTVTKTYKGETKIVLDDWFVDVRNVTGFMPVNYDLIFEWEGLSTAQWEVEVQFFRYGTGSGVVTKQTVQSSNLKYTYNYIKSYYSYRVEIIIKTPYTSLNLTYRQNSYDGLFYRSKNKENLNQIAFLERNAERFFYHGDDVFLDDFYRYEQNESSIGIRLFVKHMNPSVSDWPEPITMTAIQDDGTTTSQQIIEYRTGSTPADLIYQITYTTEFKNTKELKFTFPYEWKEIQIAYVQRYPSSIETRTSYSETQEAVRNSLIQRLSVIKGELWYKQSYGLPLMEKIRNKGIYDSIIIQIINSHPDVKNIVSFNSRLEDHHYYFNFIVSTIFDEEVEVNYSL